MAWAQCDSLPTVSVLGRSADAASLRGLPSLGRRASGKDCEGAATSTGKNPIHLHDRLGWTSALDRRSSCRRRPSVQAPGMFGRLSYNCSTPASHKAWGPGLCSSMLIRASDLLHHVLACFQSRRVRASDWPEARLHNAMSCNAMQCPRNCRAKRVPHCCHKRHATFHLVSALYEDQDGPVGSCSCHSCDSPPLHASRSRASKAFLEPALEPIPRIL